MSIQEEATGVRNAHGYIQYATEQGYPIIRVLDWTSSAGDWSFLISKDNKEWRILYQTNNYPKAGFSYEISEESYFGTEQEVIKELEQLWT